MHFVIVGAGALGSLYAAFLARDGHDVSLLARGERAAQLAEDGITVTGLADFNAKCDVVIEGQTLRHADALIMAVKTYDTDAVLATLSNLQPASAFSVQNGMLKNRQLAEAFGADAVLGAVGHIGGQVLGAGSGTAAPVRYTLDGATIVGELNGGHSKRAQAIVDSLMRAGLVAEHSQQISTAEWSKFVGWSGFSALAILTRLPTYKFLSDPDTAVLAARVMRETGALARHLGIELQDSGALKAASVTAGSEEDGVQAVLASGAMLEEMAPSLRQSMLQDADRGKRLEVDETLGYALELAGENGIQTPTLDYCVRIMRAVSRAADPDRTSESTTP